MRGQEQLLRGLCVALFVTAPAVLAEGSPFISSSSKTPSPDGTYVGENSVTFATVGGGPDVELGGVFDRIYNNGTDAPTIDNPHTSATGESEWEISLTIVQVTIDNGVKVAAETSADYLPAHNFKVEIAGFVIGDFPGNPEWILRESPTLQSTGLASVELLPSGLFLADSFFDIFFELSVDGGQTWTPASGPMHLESIPEPSTLALAGIGALALIAVATRRRIA